MKVGNPNWKLLEMEPVDISLRNQVGHALDPADLDLLPGIVSEMLAHPEAWRKKIEDVRSKLIFNLGQGGSVAGSYLLECVLDKQNSRKEDDGESR